MIAEELAGALMRALDAYDSPRAEREYLALRRALACRPDGDLLLDVISGGQYPIAAFLLGCLLGAMARDQEEQHA